MLENEIDENLVFGFDIFFSEVEYVLFVESERSGGKLEVWVKKWKFKIVVERMKDSVNYGEM